MYNSNHVSIAHRLAVTVTQIFFSYLLSLEQNVDSDSTPPRTDPYPVDIFFFKIDGFLPGSEGRLPSEMK